MATRAVDVSRHLPAADPGALPAIDALPAGAPLVVHVAAPLLPLVLMRLPRALVRGRRVVGFWN